jgi:CubicO group peptidase (beta-lactamase class C family)
VSLRSRMGARSEAIPLALVAGFLVASLAIVAAVASAQGSPDEGTTESAESDRSALDGPAGAREVEAFFDGLIPEQLREEHLAGATVAVVKDGRTVFAKGYGYADRAKREPVVADRTLFYPGSAGKLFTWTAVMQLAEEGKLDLDADINSYLDFEIPDAYAKPITLADLMTHTAGFEEQYAAQLAADGDDVLPLRELLIRYMPERVYPPGETYAYSNYGTALAGYVVQRASGEPYERYVTEHILEPLSMELSAATQPLPEYLAPDLSKGYHYEGGAYDAKAFEWVSNAPSAPVHATATDMASFMLAHLGDGEYAGGRILESSTATEMHRRQYTPDPRLPGMAYGFINSQANGRRLLLHDGESARFSSVVALLPDEDTGLFVSYNTPYEPFETLSAFMDHFYPPRGEAPEPRANLGGQAESWTGTYVPARAAHTSPQKIVGWLDPLRVRADGDGLRVDSPFGEQRHVVTGPDFFEQVGGEWSLVFRNEGGEEWLFMGPFPLAYFKVPAYRTLGFQLPLIAACQLLFASALIAFPVAALMRWRRGGARMPRAARVARWLAAIAGALNLVLLAWFVLTLLGFAQTYVWPTQTVTTVARLWLLSVPLALGIALLATLAWKNRFWGVAGRVHYTLVALASVLFVVFLSNWNLIGL